jgi:beta-glucosidase
MLPKSIALCAAAFLSVAAAAQNAPWMNPSLPPDERASLIQAQMTRAEKLVLIRGYYGDDSVVNPNAPHPPEEIRNALPHAAGYIPGIARLGIPAQLETDASLGVSNQRHMRPGDTATALPATLLTAASFNPEIAYLAGAVVGQETRDKGFNVLLNGGVDLARDPRNGRNFEYAGEDPLLAGTIVGETIRGAQDRHIISTAKHFAINDQETGRDWLSANIGEQALRESDLLAFQIAIEKGDPGSIMCAYNRLNGTYACEHDFLLNKVLKGDWKYPGYVMSDWGGVHSTAKAMLAGLDQDSAYEFDRADYFGVALQKALDGPDGAALQTRLDDMVHRILRSMFAKGLFDLPLVPKAIDVAANGDAAQRTAEEGIVLLKNARNLLPLVKAKRIAVIGGRADIGVLSGGGAAQVMPIGNAPEQEILAGGSGQNADGTARIPHEKMVYDPPSPLAALRAETRARVVFDDGSDLAHAAASARHADVAIVFASVWQREAVDTPDLSLPGQQDALIAAVAKANPRTVVVLETGNPVLMPWLDKVGAVLEAWYPGNRGAVAIARILTGKVNPSGRLPITFPQSLAQLPRPAIPGVELRQPDNRWTPNETLFDVDYTVEGADVGYKWFAKQNLKPLFPFGYGLGYTSFKFGKLTAAPYTVSFEVKNSGKRSGKAVAQVYATPPNATARLVAFAKLELKPGESRRLSVAVDPRLLASFDTNAQVWRVAAGDYVFKLGPSSAESAATATVHLGETTLKP